MTALTVRLPISAPKKTAYVSVHTTRELKDLIRTAAVIKGCSTSELILDTCIEQARRVVAAADTKLNAPSGVASRPNKN